MPLGDFVQPGTIPKPLVIGRTGRLIFGVGAVFYLVWLMVQRDAITGSDVTNLGWWIGVLFAVYFLPDLFIVGLSRPWGRWPQIAVAGFAIALIAADFAAYSSGWGPPLGWGIFAFTAFFYAVIGGAFLLAAFFAVPG